MNLQFTKSSSSSVYWLPKTLEGKPGEVDSSFLLTLWQSIPKSSSKIRSLIKDLAPGVLTPKDSAIEKLSEIILDPILFTKWITQEKKPYPSLGNLTTFYVDAHDESLSFDRLKKIGFMIPQKGTKGRYMPDLEKLPNLANIIKDSQLGDRYLSLLIWKLITESKIAKAKYPTDQPLQMFEKELIRCIEDHGLNHLLVDVWPADWKFETAQQVGASNGIENKYSGDIQQSFKITSAPKVCDTSETLIAAVKALELKLDKYFSLVNAMQFRAKAISSEDEPASSLRQLQEYSTTILGSLIEIKKEVASVNNDLKASLNSRLEKVGLSWEGDDQFKFKITGAHSWFASAYSRIKDNADLFRILGTLTDASALEQIKKNKLAEGLVYQYSEVHDALGQIQQDYIKIKREISANSFFSELIKEKLKQLDWNIFKDATIKADYWADLANHFMRTGKMGPGLGISVQQSFNETYLDFGRFLLCEVQANEKHSIASRIQALSWLNLGQQERLASEVPALRSVIALTQLEAYFEALNQGLDHFIYWSASPLGDISNTHSSLVVRNFFKSIYDIVSAPGNEPLSTQTLTFCISSAKIQKINSVNDKGSLNAFTGELKDILAYRKKGGRTTYAHIWQAAYEDVFSPLLIILNASGLKAFTTAFEKWSQSFVIDYHLDTWKAEIPEHLKKNSEYDKFLRNQISLKTAEIQAWMDIFQSVNKKSQASSCDPLLSLKTAINKVLRSTEQDCIPLREWIDSKTAIQNVKPNSYICQSRDSTSALDLKSDFKHIDAFHPRAFAQLLDDSVTWEAIYTDDLIASFGHATTEYLVELYAANELYEGYALIANDSIEEISPALDRKVEKRTEELEADLKQRVGALNGFREDPELAAELARATQHIENQQWRLAAKCLYSAEDISSTIRASAKNMEERKRLLEKIAKLGGALNPEATLKIDNDELKATLDALQQSFKNRRVHINVIERLLDLKSTEFEAELAECLGYLDAVERYPNTSVSEQVAYFLEQAIDPIYSELSRSQTLLPAYASQLRKLAKILIFNIREDNYLFEESSDLIAMLVDTADHWQRLSAEGKTCVDQILEVFSARGIKRLEEPVVTASAENKSLSTSDTNIITDYDKEFDTLTAMASKYESYFDPPMLHENQDISKLINDRDWISVANALHARLKAKSESAVEDLISWAVSAALTPVIPFNTVEMASVLRAVNSKRKCSVVRFLHQDKSARPAVADLCTRFIASIAIEVDGSSTELKSYSALDALQTLNANFTSTLLYQNSFRHAFEVEAFETLGLRSYWDRFAGDQKQAEARAMLMYLAWKLRATRALAYCLTLPPIDIERRKAEALAKVAEDALASGNSELLQGFFDLKKSIQAKPFQIFADLVLSNAVSHGENAARLMLSGGLERHNDDTLRSILRIEPRKIDSPDSIVLKLPHNCPVRFANGALSETINGPFFTDTSLPIAFKLIDKNAVAFSVEIACAVVSLTGASSNFSQQIDFSILGDGIFQPLSPDQIDEAFDNFPGVHMRGTDYVPRIIDEQKIEKALFSSKTVRSLWISSPRRSGKTTMLYRILDAFSHKVQRDNLVVYLTLDEHFADSTAFNRWIWRRLRTFSPNKELRDLYEDFENIGRDLPFDSDTGTFVGELSDRLLRPRDSGTRIIFLIDEVDRFASMYFEGGAKKNAAVDILWQIRHTITDRRDIGMVFAGSSAAKQVFIADAESPFYNSIDHLELTPFSCNSESMEEASRQITQPHKVRMKYELPKASLEHLIWVCAGIPYYMKLVAGATFAKVKQSHILTADVNEGLRALLNRDTGISKLDDMGGDPGSDDLRTTISIEKNMEGILAKAVLYAFADIHSPISGHKTYRGKLSSSESRLVSHYNISKSQIERGLDICVKLGLIRLTETESAPEIDFVIPILGESLRKSSGRLWANIDHELISISQGRG